LALQTPKVYRAGFKFMQHKRARAWVNQALFWYMAAQASSLCGTREQGPGLTRPFFVYGSAGFKFVRQKRAGAWLNQALFCIWQRRLQVCAAKESKGLV
jgi:hypothetical protein